MDLALVSAGGSLYALGGSADNSKPIAEVDRYDPTADQWTAGLKSLNPHEGETLLKVTRQIFPHDRLDDTDFEAAAVEPRI